MAQNRFVGLDFGTSNYVLGLADKGETPHAVKFRSGSNFPSQRGRGFTMPLEKTLCMVAQPRSGTNHVCRLLETLLGIHVYLEPFNPVEPHFHYRFSLKRFEQAAQRSFDRPGDPALTGWIHDNPEKALDVLRHAADPGCRVMSLKLFADHVSPDQFETYFVRRPDTHFMTVKRRPIDAYISFQKAMSLKTWLFNNTTDMRLPIDADHFARWHISQSAWYRMTDEMIRAYDRPHTSLQYETDIAGPPAVTVRHLIGKLKEIGIDTRMRHSVRIKRPVKQALHHAAKAVGLTSPWSPALGLPRQDLNGSTADKVSNWDAFCEDLSKRHDTAMLDRYFTELD
ncbi:MAG: hypothetical protein ACFB6R_18520 [Alphaproteobacteria bacterium]